MLSVNSSVSVSMSVPYCGAGSSRRGSSRRPSVAERSRSRYGTSVGRWTSVIPARHLALVVGEDHGLAADREVAPLGVALVVLGHQNSPQVRVPVEADP